MDFQRLLNTKVILIEVVVLVNPYLKDKEVHSIPKGISPKVNSVWRLEFELAYHDVTVVYIYIYIYIYTNFIKHCIQGELIYVLSIVVCTPRTV